jgi:hypothetical protein
MPGAPSLSLPVVIAPGGDTNSTFTVTSGLFRPDVLLLYDTTNSSQNDRSLLKNEMDNFFAYFSSANGFIEYVTPNP